MKHLSFDATISVLNAETSAIVWSYRRYWRRVFGNIGDCGVGITPQMCNRVTNHGDMGTFSKPVVLLRCQTWYVVLLCCHVWHVTDSLFFVYILPIESSIRILFIKQYFLIKINNLQCV